MRNRCARLAAPVLAVCAFPLVALAQDYPTKPAGILVPYAPGGPTELVSRMVGDGLSKRLGQPFIIETRPGANTRIATEAAARAPADGYTLLMVSTPFSTNPALFPSLPYDTVRDFRTPEIPCRLLQFLPLFGGSCWYALNSRDAT